MSDDISQLGRYRADSEVGRLRAEIERLTSVLKALIECCETTRDSAFHDRRRYTNNVSQAMWSAFCLQIRVAHKAVAEGEPPQ